MTIDPLITYPKIPIPLPIQIWRRDSEGTCKIISETFTFKLYFHDPFGLDWPSLQLIRQTNTPMTIIRQKKK